MDAETRRLRTPSQANGGIVVSSIDRYDEVDVFVGLDVGKGVAISNVLTGASAQTQPSVLSIPSNL